MIDVVSRLALTIMYGVIAWCAWRTAAHNHMFVARKVATYAIAGIATLWCLLWLYFLVSIPASWSSTTPVLVQAWVSRVIHVPQIAGLALQLYMIRKSEDLV
jgi:hypothetical protein